MPGGDPLKLTPDRQAVVHCWAADSSLHHTGEGSGAIEDDGQSESVQNLIRDGIIIIDDVDIHSTNQCRSGFKVSQASSC